MAREATFTSYEQVARIAAELSVANGGRSPSVRAIRDQLGGGSNTTILKHIKKWMAQQPALAQAKSVIVPDVAIEGMRQGILLAVQESVLGFTTELGEVSETLKAVQFESEQAIENLAASEVKVSELETANATLKARIEDARESAAETERRLFDEIEAIKQERDRERDSAEKARTELAVTLLRLDGLPRLQTEIDECRIELAKAHAQAHDAEKKLAAASASLDSATIQLERERTALVEVKRSVQQERERADAHSNALTDAKVKIEGLEVALAAEKARNIVETLSKPAIEEKPAG